LSRRLVELMGGELILHASTPGGSTFRIRIPIGTAHTTSKKKPSTPQRHLSVVS
jgi:signal transduction histidine kinase